MLDAIERLCRREDLSDEESSRVFARLVAGEMTEVELTALLVGLKAKGEAAGEIAGAARALRRAAEPFPRPTYVFADTCGTGGDGCGTVNVSTAVAFVVAAAGLPVAKHGNRSVSSRCGSADVLEALGARIDVEPGIARRALDQVGFCFLFAPRYHTGFRHAVGVRRALRTRTILNVLGPLINPSRPPLQLMGVYDPGLVETCAETLRLLGVERAMVVHGSGLDEVAVHGSTRAAFLVDGQIELMEIEPHDLGVEPTSIDSLSGGAPEENARWMREVLAGRASLATTQAVACNAAALLYTAGRTESLRAGVTLALELMSAGTPLQHLEAYVEASHRA